MNDFHFAVVVGIDLYPGIRNLNFARGDAKAFANWLVDANGGALPQQNVELILEEGPFARPDDARPTRDAVNKAFKKVHTTARNAFTVDPTLWLNSRLYVYFSGHGLAPDPKEVAVLMADATDDILGNNIPCALYLRYYEKTQDFHEIVMFSDCCRTEKGDAPISGPPFTPDEKNFGNVVSVLGYAAQYKNVAYEPAELDDNARGFYTKALLEGLTGAIDSDSPNGEINSTSLQNYLRGRVQTLTTGKRNPQTPEMLADPAAKIVFRQGAAVPSHMVTFRFPAPFLGRVVLRNGGLAQIDTHTVNGQPWQKSLPDGLYEVNPDPPAPGIVFANGGAFKVLGEDKNVQF
jgi:caspase domain-containing protein